MRKWIVFAVAVATVLVVTGCGYQEGIRQPDRQSYVWFSGDTDGAFAIIDNDTPFEIVPTYSVDRETGEKVKKKSRTLYQIKPGKHEIVVQKNGKVVVNRVLIIGSGATKEVRVP